MHGTKNLHLVGIGLRGGRGTGGQGFLLGREEAAGFLRQAVASTSGVEASILSTWNRKEFYVAAPLGRSPAGRWWEDLCENQTGLSGAGADIYSYQANGVEVGRHLIRLACGLDSHGAGDTEVLRELRGAMELSAECGTLGGHLGRIFTQAACVGTRVRREIRAIREATNIGATVAEMLASHPALHTALKGTTKAPFLLVVGAGRIARDVTQHLSRLRLGRIACVNRTNWKAAALAAECGGRAIRWSDCAAALFKADVLITATSVHRPLWSRYQFAQTALQRAGRPLLIVDLGMPPNVPPAHSFELIEVGMVRDWQKKIQRRRGEIHSTLNRVVEEETAIWEQGRQLPFLGGWDSPLSRENIVEDFRGSRVVWMGDEKRRSTGGRRIHSVR
ncbi:MAG: hypothetical protein O6850_08210 [Acidobacteria bacterium]|nr:hypothetical protein [Acidobacteriota bacterium]